MKWPCKSFYSFVITVLRLRYFQWTDNGEEKSNDQLFQFLSTIGLFLPNSRSSSSSIYHAKLYVHLYIYIGWARVARWITTVGPTDLATALKSGLIYYYVLLLLFGYLYLYNIMPREIPRSRRYVTVQLPRDRDLIFRIGHNLGRALATSNIIYRLNSFSRHWPVEVSLVCHIR